MRLGLATILALAGASVAAACSGSWSSAGSRGPVGEPPPPLTAPALARPPRLERVIRRTDGAVALVQAPGDRVGRFHLVEKKGTIHVIEDGVAVGAPLLDLSTRVSRRDEQGLLGLAFHPRWAETGRLFVNFTDAAGDTRVVEYRAVEGRVDLATERVWLSVDQPAEIHNGGHVAFGPDGKLWIGLGDGGEWHDKPGHAQSDSSYLGKMIRLDVDRDDARPEIVAKGLRNPWRYSFDRETGDLWIGDVGQELWEEIDLVPAGHSGRLNFGWPTTEGMHCYRYSGCRRSGIVPPVLEYGHDAGCSITGGYVYRGRAIEGLAGHYFYADYCSGLIRSFRLGADRIEESWDWKPLLDPDSRLANVSSFAEDSEGELYVITMWDGVYKLVPR